MARLGDIARTLAFGEGKAVGATIEKRTTARGAELIFPSDSYRFGRFGGGSSKRHLETYAGRDDAIDWVFSCANLIGETAANAPYHFETATGKEVPRTRAEAEPSQRVAPVDLIELLEQPNPYQSWEDLVEILFIDWLIAGDMFILKYAMDADGKPAALYRLSPALVDVVPGKGTQLIKGYDYSVPGKDKVTFAANEVCQVKRPNPHSEYRGASIIAAGPSVYDMELALQTTKTQYYEQGTRLSGVLETERTLNEGVIGKIRRQFLGTYAGTSNSYKVAVLERGLKFSPISSNAAEAMFGEMTDQSRDRILAMFNVPKSMLGMETENRSAQGQAAEDRREFANSKMRPLLDKFQRAITQEITSAWGLRLVIDYKYKMPIENRVSLAGEFAKLPGVTVKEVREFAELEPLGDERDEIVLNLPGDNENESEVKDRNLPGEAGRPPNGENTAAFPKPGEPAPKDAQVRTFEAGE